MSKYSQIKVAFTMMNPAVTQARNQLQTLATEEAVKNAPKLPNFKPQMPGLGTIRPNLLQPKPLTATTPGSPHAIQPNAPPGTPPPGGPHIGLKQLQPQAMPKMAAVYLDGFQEEKMKKTASFSAGRFMGSLKGLGREMTYGPFLDASRDARRMDNSLWTGHPIDAAKAWGSMIGHGIGATANTAAAASLLVPGVGEEVEGANAAIRGGLLARKFQQATGVLEKAPQLSRAAVAYREGLQNAGQAIRATVPKAPLISTAANGSKVWNGFPSASHILQRSLASTAEAAVSPTNWRTNLLRWNLREIPINQPSPLQPK